MEELSQMLILLKYFPDSTESFMSCHFIFSLSAVNKLLLSSEIYWRKFSSHHFNQPGHTLSRLSGLVLEHVKSLDPFVHEQATLK